jgi:SAM-dependent methyltransferase
MAPEFDTYADEYARRVDESISFSGMKVENFVAGKAAHLERMFGLAKYTAADRILDVGCGVGQYEALLGGRFNLTGVDTSTSSIEKARQVSPGVDFRSYGGDVLPFADAEFACAFTICVVHHVPLEERQKFIAEVLRVLKSGGLFLVYEHNPWNPLTRWAVERCVFDKDAILLSSTYAGAWMRSNGFRDVRTEFLFTIPPVSSALVRFDRFARWCPLGAQYVTYAAKP